MAQDFVGSNNLNLMVPSGQFGTRLAGGKDAASPRYIFTHLAPVARYLFPEEDDVLLDYLEDDGQMIEPTFYCPIIPLLLVNGTQGIGTGWSTFIPPHHPKSVVDYIRAKLDNLTELPLIEPHANGFKGDIVTREDGSGYVSYGKVEELDKKTILITELPIGVWTDNYKSHLLKMVSLESVFDLDTKSTFADFSVQQSKGLITGLQEDHTTTKVSFKISLKPSQLERMRQTGLEKALKLTTNLPLTNMHAFDEFGSMRRFSSPEDIANCYFPTRLSLYEDRKSVLKSKLNHTSALLKNKARFIELVAGGQLELLGGKVTKEESYAKLKELEFQTFADLEEIRTDNSLRNKRGGKDVPLDEEIEISGSGSDFDYLFKMPLSSLTTEKIADLNRDVAKAEENLKEIQQADTRELWMTDLDRLASHL